MKKLLLALGILALICSPATAGRNANGALLVHTDDAVIYTPLGADYCATAMPTDSTGFNANGTEGIAREQMIWVLWYFLPEASPSVTAVQFGIRHNLPVGYVTDYAACDGPLEIYDTGWPETGFGAVLAYPGPINQHINAIYWFAVARDDETAYFGTRSYPSTNEAKFVDDSSPGIEDLCTHFGTLRWDGTGDNDFPGGVPLVGACCYPDGSCQLVPRSACQGQYLGDGTVCDPNPCEQPEACCFEGGACTFVLPTECALAGGTAQGPGSDCDPNLCFVPPVPEACCFQDGHCEFILTADCTAQGGAPQGAGTTCETVVCPPPTATGACCLDDQGHCQVMTETECIGQNGQYQGDNSTCEPTNPCPIVPTRNATWGQIKANYR